MTQPVRTSSCACGNVKCEARGEPFLNAACYCVDCQTAGREIEALEGAARVCTPDGGTAYMTFRQDQWRVVAGKQFLNGMKLGPTAPTTRYVAVCCNSAMYLKNKYGFWVSTYKGRFLGDTLPLEWRHKLKARISDLPVPTDIPFYQGFPLRLWRRILRARFIK